MDWRNPNKKEYGPGLDPVESETDDVPVSYTHLDVYKRQPTFSFLRRSASSDLGWTNTAKRSARRRKNL